MTSRGAFSCECGTDGLGPHSEPRINVADWITRTTSEFEDHRLFARNTLTMRGMSSGEARSPSRDRGREGAPIDAKGAASGVNAGVAGGECLRGEQACMLFDMAPNARNTY